MHATCQRIFFKFITATNYIIYILLVQNYRTTWIRWEISGPIKSIRVDYLFSPISYMYMYKYFINDGCHLAFLGILSVTWTLHYTFLNKAKKLCSLLVVTCWSRGNCHVVTKSIFSSVVTWKPSWSWSYGSLQLPLQSVPITTKVVLDTGLGDKVC